MAELKISEAGSVQFPMVGHAAAVGWTPISPADATKKRGGEAGMLFRDELEAALGRFTPWMNEDAIRQVIERLQAIPPTIEGNRELLSWMRGERQWYDDDEKRQRPVRFIDFETPAKNTFHVTWEWKLKPPARKGNRADAMFIVNGLPVCIVEHKNPKDRAAIDRGVAQLRRYEKETPELLGSPQLFNVTHLLDYWYGVTWNVNRRYMARWKQEPEETYRFAVQAFFEPTDFLRTLQHWILFYVEDGETRKSVLREHQRTAIDKIVERCADTARKRGLIWHTQGAGKTFTLLTAARLILEQKPRFANATVIVVVDRTELEGQLKGWVEKLLGEMQQQDISVWRAHSKADLRELLQTDKRGLIVSMIHKFENIEKDANVRDNVYVFIDEAHRSVARELGTCLMAALPNSTIIGFTGTPVGRTEQGQGTFAIFGADDEQRYLHKYSIAESISDETTLPIRYTMAPGDMSVPARRLDREFLQLADAEAVTDVDELNRVLDRAVALRTFLTADDRVEKVAAFVAKHFRESVEPLGYKAFLVGVNREACARYKRALDQLLPPEWSVPVYSENVADIVDRPLVAELQLSEEQIADTRLMFRKPSEGPKILIVTDKLLTGYDAPLLYCLYLDKPMRDHVLLQAMARVNRPYIDTEGRQKRIGLVVDFVGVLRELEKALRFDSEDLSGVIEDLDLLFDDLLERITTAKKDYLDTGDEGAADERLEKMVYGRFLEREPRKRFFEAYKEIEALWEILSPSPELRDCIPTCKALAGLYAATWNAYANQAGSTTDLARKTSRLVQESATQEGLGRLTKSVTFDARTIEELRSKPGPDEGKVFNLVRGLRQEIESDQDTAPILLSLCERAERILEDIQNRRTTGLAAMERFATMAREKEEAIKAAEASGLSPRAFAVHWRLKDDADLAAAGIATLDLARKAETLLGRFPNAAVNAEEQRRLRAALYLPLLAFDADARIRVVDSILTTLLGEGVDTEA